MLLSVNGEVAVDEEAVFIIVGTFAHTFDIKILIVGQNDGGGAGEGEFVEIHFIIHNGVNASWEFCLDAVEHSGIDALLLSVGVEVFHPGLGRHPLGIEGLVA